MPHPSPTLLPNVPGDQNETIRETVFRSRVAVPLPDGKDDASLTIQRAVFRGPPGVPPGQINTANLFYSGTGPPAASLANAGDYYLDTNTGNLYLKS